MAEKSLNDDNRLLAVAWKMERSAKPVTPAGRDVDIKLGHISMIDRRHQVFVSSTYIDLIEERSEVMQALLELECMPAGMELFPAANDTQWDWIKRIIDESDYYVVIVGGRYGSLSKETGLSFTEMEYRYAVETSKPVIAFLIEDQSQIVAKNLEQQPNKIKKLEAFRDLVKSRLCKFYSSPADLGAKLSRSITQLKKQHPKPGWIRAEILDSLASSDEVLHLKRENEELKKRLLDYGLAEPRSKEHLASGDEEFKVNFFFVREVRNDDTGRYRKKAEEWSAVLISWDEIFSRIGPTLLGNDSNYWSPVRALNDLAENHMYGNLEVKYPNERFTNFRVSSECCDTVLLQLRALKLIEIDDQKFWQITPYGDNYLVSLLGVRKGAQSAGTNPVINADAAR
jgi:hypothetical protein